MRANGEIKSLVFGRTDSQLPRVCIHVAAILTEQNPPWRAKFGVQKLGQSKPLGLP
jgi:hypothetical protein